MPTFITITYCYPSHDQCKSITGRNLIEINFNTSNSSIKVPARISADRVQQNKVALKTLPYRFLSSFLVETEV